MAEEQKIFLVSQKSIETEKPTQEDVFEIGTIATVKQIMKLPKQIMRVLVEGEVRGRLINMSDDAPYLQAEVEIIEDDEAMPETLDDQAMLRGLKDIFVEYAAKNGKFSKESIGEILEIQDVKKLVDEIAANVPLPYMELQDILNQTEFEQRYETLCFKLVNEIQIIAIKDEIRAKVKERVDKHQREYILREQLKLIREELGEDSTISDAEEFESATKKLNAPKEVKEKLFKEIKRFKSSMNSPAEIGVIRTYIETLLEMPWNKTVKENTDLAYAEKILDADHYGLEQVKERVLEFLAVRTLTKKGESPILCLVGPPGTGKTSIARSLARALQKPYVRISLGGVRDEAEIRGHRRTYVGAMPGRIANGLKTAGVKNPVMLLDEIDKVSSDYKGDTFSALLEVLDSEQNSKFQDHYMEVPLDLSEVLFIATANSLQTIPRPLLDRMEIIEVSSYTGEEKFHIAKKHLIPKQLEECGFTSKELKFTQKAIYALIDFYTREAGVRTLERLIASVMRKCAVEKLTEGTEVFKIDEKEIERFLGHKKFIPDSLAKMDEIGIVNGLAWTSVGGEILPIEVAVMEGTGKIELTGSLGDVMQESAKTAITCIRSHAVVLGIDSDFYKNKDIHIHAPEGAVPKDGPSAGITMATAIYSALTLKPARHDIAMTGEITLRGNVLPIGGLKEKSMAAFKNGITTVIIPKDNEPDLEDVDKAVLEKVKFIPVRNFSEVVALAVNNTVRITDNQWNGIDMTAVRSATKTVNAVKQ